MQSEDSDDKMVELDDFDENETGIVIMPIKIPVDTNQLNNAILREPVDDDETIERGERLSIKSQIDRSTLSFYGVYKDPQETVDIIVELSGIEADESLTHAAQCGAFWKSLGAETIIYMSSFGGTMIANGLLIRFAGFNALASTLFFGNVAVTALPNARILFSSLIKPPKDNIPEDNKSCYQALDKYTFMPISWMIKAASAGGTLAILEDSSFATQQVVGALTSMVIGPVTLGLRGVARSCLKGSVTLDPGYPDVKTAFKNAYSSDPNPNDNDRSYRWGSARDIFNRGLIISGTTLALILNNGLAIQTYCIGGRSELERILANNGTITNNDINQYCFGGSMTYMFRELGYTFAYSAGMMVLEPILNAAFNKLYDFFYPRREETGDDENN